MCVCMHDRGSGDAASASCFSRLVVVTVRSTRYVAAAEETDGDVRRCEFAAECGSQSRRKREGGGGGERKGGEGGERERGMVGEREGGRKEERKREKTGKR